MTQIAERLEQRGDWYFPHESNVEAQIRIVLRQLNSLTLREMAVSFPWPTREMAGAEVLPIRSMRPEEKRKWLQQLWGLLTVEKNKEAAARGRASSSSNARFEAPRPRSRSPLPASIRSQSPRPETPPPPFVSAAPVPVAAQFETLNLNAPGIHRAPSPSMASLRRSNATNASRRLSQPGMGAPAAIPPHLLPPDRPRRFSASRNLAVPGVDGSGSVNYAYLSDGEDYASSGDERYSSYARSVSPSPSASPSRGGDGGLTRLLSVKRPNDSVLADAMSLALFRVNED